VSKDVKSLFDTEARTLDREAMAAKADMQQLVGQLAALPPDAQASIRERIDSDRRRLEAIVAQAERVLQKQHVDRAAELASLELELEGQVDELKRKRIEASKAEAEADYENNRYTLESARVHATDGIELGMKSVRVSESSLSRGY